MQEMQEPPVRSPGGGDALEEETATHSCSLAWVIPWTEEPGGLQPIRFQRVRHNLAPMHILATIIKKTAIKIDMHIFLKLVSLFSSCKYPKVKLLDHMVALVLVFWAASILFSMVAGPIYTPINSTWFHFLHVLNSSVQSLSRVWLFVTPWIAARQASLSITNSSSPPKPMSIESVMPSNHLIFCRPLLLLPPIPPSIRVFSNESTLLVRWPKHWSFSFSITPSNGPPGLISFSR